MTARGLFSRYDSLLGLPDVQTFQEPPEESRIILREETRRLSERIIGMNLYRDYYEGNQNLVYGSAKFQAEVGANFKDFADNWAKVVVNAMANRLHVEGFAINEDLDAERVEELDFEGGTEELNRRIWTILARNNYDEMQDELHTGTLVEGRATAIVWPDPVLRVRVDWNPGQNVIVRYNDDNTRVMWAMKRWQTPSGMVRVNLYFPNRVEKYYDLTFLPSKDQDTTEFRERLAEVTSGSGYVVAEPTMANPLGEVPVVEFRNREGSEIRDVISQQNALNYLMISALNAAGHAGFAQRVMMTNTREPEGGWSNQPGVVWRLPHTYDPDGNPIESKIGEFTPPDLDKFVNIVQEFLRHVASTTGTPMRFFYQSDRGGRGDAASGEALRVDDEPLIDKIEAAQRRFGNRWYEVYRLVAKAASLTSINPFPVGEPYWTDPQARHRTLLLQDAKMMKDLGIPFEFFIERVGFSPLEVKRIMELRQEGNWAKAPGTLEELPEGMELEEEESEPPAQPSSPTPPPS